MNVKLCKFIELSKLEEISGGFCVGENACERCFL